MRGCHGLYDGQGLTTRASAWELADTLALPVLLVVQPKGASITPLAAELRGLLQFRTPSHIVGILLNDCSESLYKTLRPMLEAETGLTVVGYLPHLPGCAIESRHLGLKTAGEVADLQQKLGKLADALVLDWAQLAVLTDRPAPAAPPLAAPCTPSVRIAVARDEAFCFAYAETLDALRDAGAELAFFSPLRDAALPENIGGLYLPGATGTVCPAAERELRPACCYPGGCSERVAHRCRVRRLSVLRAGAGGYGRQNLPHGGCAAGQRAQHRAAGALWLCRHDGKGRQYAFPRRRNAARP